MKYIKQFRIIIILLIIIIFTGVYFKYFNKQKIQDNVITGGRVCVITGGRV